MSQPQLSDRSAAMLHDPAQRGPADHPVPGEHARRHLRSATVAIMLGLVLTLGYGLVSASPSSASVAGPDTSADQSTGPTDPNGPPY